MRFVIREVRRGYLVTFALCFVLVLTFLFWLASEIPDGWSKYFRIFTVLSGLMLSANFVTWFLGRFLGKRHQQQEEEKRLKALPAALSQMEGGMAGRLRKIIETHGRDF
ncbi:MAG: hypothetical protein NT154_09645 [Verrucomicrobia bacterium]|nr:hypothetical protein [Verrucomicrobiota bacterium]